MDKQNSDNLDYRSAGVDIGEGNRAVDLIKDMAAGTFDERVLAPLGSFASMFDISWLTKEYREPVLVQSVDGVGTKISVARMANDYSTIGEDLFNACTNDIAVHGARPLTFLDYIANDKLDADIVASIVKGLAKACAESSVALVGGETAEMPGVYLPGEHDLVGLVTGVVERDRIVDGSTAGEGNVLLAVGSSGLHTNGYSLARKVLFEHAGFSLTDRLPTDPSITIGEALLSPHVNYVNGILRLLEEGAPIRSMAHITGGGLIENVPRVLPKGVHARFYPSTWQSPPIFETIGTAGDIPGREMFRTFNMGLGLVIAVEQSEAHAVLRRLGELFSRPVWQVGVIAKGTAATWIEGVTP